MSAFTPARHVADNDPRARVERAGLLLIVLFLMWAAAEVCAYAANNAAGAFQLTHTALHEIYVTPWLQFVTMGAFIVFLCVAVVWAMSLLPVSDEVMRGQSMSPAQVRQAIRSPWGQYSEDC